MTTIHHYARSHQRRVIPPAGAAQPLRGSTGAAGILPITMPITAHEAAPAEIPVTVAIPERTFNPDNLLIPAPLLPPMPEPTPPLGERLRERLREAYDRLHRPAPRPAPQPAPAFAPNYNLPSPTGQAALAWALR